MNGFRLITNFLANQMIKKLSTYEKTCQIILLISKLTKLFIDHFSLNI